MSYSQLIAIVGIIPFAAGCASFPVDQLANEVVQGTVNFGHDFLSGTSEMVGAFVEAVPAAVNVRVHCPTIPWRQETTRRSSSTSPSPENVQTPLTRPSASAWLGSTMQAYQEFDYEKAVSFASNLLQSEDSPPEKGQAYVLRGASLYLLNQIGQARANFDAAKSCGVGWIDPKVYPADMVEFFHTPLAEHARAENPRTDRRK